jgi:dethiobiotin synthetase
MAGYFITGTDTGCGKTEISLGLMQLLQNQGQQVLGMKPVASGAEQTPDGLRNEDALKLQAQGSRELPYSAINPFAYEPPIAPHLAARQAGESIDLNLVVAHYTALAAQADSVIVEGVGGWRVPLNDTQGIPDLAVMLDLPVILVVGLKLGCINHALLSVESVLASGVQLVGWVGNVVEREMLELDGNVETLKGLIGVPCFGVVPYMDEVSISDIARHLELPL